MHSQLESCQLNRSRQSLQLLKRREEIRDKRLVKNWRPISLINVSTKIASKALALRMRKVIPSIINYDQTAYVKGRFIGESIRLYLKEIQTPCAPDVPWLKIISPCHWYFQRFSTFSVQCISWKSTAAFPDVCFLTQLKIFLCFLSSPKPLVL